jgi:hypothetical protein
MPCTKPVWMPGWRKIDIDMDHIMSGHYPEGARVSPLKDVFPSTMSSDSVENAIRSAYKNSEIILRQGDRYLMRGPFDGRYHIYMWVNKVTKTIETAWPKY